MVERDGHIILLDNVLVDAKDKVGGEAQDRRDDEGQKDRLLAVGQDEGGHSPMWVSETN